MPLLCAIIVHLLALAAARPVLLPQEEPSESFDAIISLQGGRPVDVDGNEVRCTAKMAGAQPRPTCAAHPATGRTGVLRPTDVPSRLAVQPCRCMPMEDSS